MIVPSLDIGGTHLRIGAIDQTGTVLKFEKLSTASVIRSGNVLSDLSAFVRSFSAGLSVDAIAIGFPARSTGPDVLWSRLRTSRSWKTCRYVTIFKRNSPSLSLPSGM